MAWLNRLRADAVDRVGALTVPTTRDEEWRFTDISPLTRLSFQPVRTESRLQAADVERFFLEEAATRLVFVDGVYAPQLSGAAKDRGVVVMNLAAAVSAHAAQSSRIWAVTPKSGTMCSPRSIPHSCTTAP